MMYALLVSLLLLFSSASLAVEPNTKTELSKNVPSDTPASNKNIEALSVSIDNDLFVPVQSDKDYTAGFALTFHGTPNNALTKFGDDQLANIDTFLIGPINTNASKRERGSTLLSQGFEFGSYGFTPEDIEARTLDRSDRPYASLVYLSSSRTYLVEDSRDSWTSSLTLGVLGADVFRQGQSAVHKVLNGDEARGWSQQISEGGELTARYQLAYHQRLGSKVSNSQLKASYFASLGYLSEIGLALSYRDGLISSPDYRFNPALTSYGENAHASDAGPEGDESYFWGGVGLKLRAYNVFLEGQFRDSEHSFDKGELNSVLAEAWLGYSKSLFKHTKLSYVVRAQSSEIKSGTGDRGLIWGGFVLSKKLG